MALDMAEPCPHDISDQDVAAHADGLCPLCLVTELAGFRALAKELSDALLSVSPLGGSELFRRLGDEYYADPAICKARIEELRRKLHEARSDVARIRRQVRDAVGGARE